MGSKYPTDEVVSQPSSICAVSSSYAQAYHKSDRLI